jgi:RecA-family ATPase
MADRFYDLFTTPLPDAPAWITGGVLIKGAVMLACGPAKIGKSQLIVDIADSLTRGGCLWGVEGFEIPEPVATLYLDGELGKYGLHQRVRYRYEALGYPPAPNLFYLSKPKGFMLDTMAGAELLAREVAATKAKVVIVDPISKFLHGDENSNTDVNRLFQNLNGLVADTNDLSFVLVHHYGKPPKPGTDGAAEYDPLDAYNARGAAKWFDSVDTLVTIQMQKAVLPGEDRRFKTGWKPRHAPEPAPITLALHPGGLVSQVVEPRGLPVGRGPLYPTTRKSAQSHRR